MDIAYKVSILDIIKGEFKEDSSGSYIITDFGLQINKVNLMGLVVDKSGDYSSNIIMDDGTAKIPLRVFDEKLAKNSASLEVGQKVVVLGRIMQYNGEKCVIPYVLKKINNSLWLKVRKIEIEQSRKLIKKPDIEKYSNLEEKVIQTVKMLDSGAGAEIDEIHKTLAQNGINEDTEAIIKRLLAIGDLYHVGPSKVKIM